MRRLLRYLWRILVNVSTGVLALIPVVLLAAWAVIYLVQVVQFALSPGVPLRYELKGAEGTVVLEADSYRIEMPPDGSEIQMVLERPRATAEDGRRLASIDRVVVQYDDGVFDVRAGNAEALIRRLQDGRFELQRFLPKATDEPPQARVRLRIGRAVIRYEDATEAPTMARDVTLSDIKWQHAMTDGLGGAVVSLPEVGAFPVTVQAADGGHIWADAQFQGTDLAPLWPVVRRWIDTRGWGEFSDLGARKLRLTGPVRFKATPGQTPRFVGQWQVDGEGLTAGPYARGARLTGQVETDGSLWSGRLSSQEPGRQVDFDGAISWQNGLVIAGRTEARLDSDRRLWPLLGNALPAGTSFRQGLFRGWVTYADPGYFVTGDLTASVVTYGADSVGALRGQLRATDQGLALRADGATWLGRGVQGSVGIDYRSGRLAGFARVENGPLRPVAARFGTDQVFGRGEAQLVLGGTTRDPVVEIIARGTGTAQVLADYAVFLGDFEARLRVDDEGVTVRRLVVDGPNGTATVDGAYAWANQQLELRVQGASVPLRGFVEDVRGTAFFALDVTGTVARPVAKGNVEVYGAEYMDRGFPQVIARVEADRETLTIEEVRAQIGAASVVGQGTYTYASGAMDGTLLTKDLLISDFFGEDVVGTASATEITIAGTLEDPMVTAVGAADNVLVYGVLLDRVTGEVRLRGDDVEVDTELLLGGGTADVVVRADRVSGSGTVTALFEGVPLDRAPGQDVGTSLAGSAWGSGSLTFVDREISLAELDARVDDLAVNGRAVGAGSVEANLADGVVTASGQVGSIDGYIELAPSTYGLDSREFDVRSTVFNVAVADVLPFLGEWRDTLSPDGQRLVGSLAGLVSGELRGTGTDDDFTLVANGVVVDELRIGGRAAGRVKADGRYDAAGLTVSALAWEPETGSVVAQGTLGADGEIAATIDATNFDLTWLNTFDPRLPLISGSATTTVVASGTVDDPTARASLQAGDFSVLTKDGERVQVPLDVIVDDIQLAARQITLNGNLFFRGLSAKLEGRAPLSALGIADPDAPDAPPGQVWGRVRLDPRQISDFAEYVTWIDTTQSSGTIEGEAILEGPLDAIVVTGGFQVNGERVVIAGIDGAFTGVGLVGTVDANGVRVAGQATSPFGGAATLNASLAAAPAKAGASPGIADFEAGSLSGQLNLDRFRWRQRLPGAETASDASANGVVTLAGSLQRPVIGGRVALTDSTIDAPTELPASGPGEPFPIDIVFDNLVVTAEPGTRLKAGGADLRVRGDGLLAGSLAAPEVRVPLTVLSGVFRLPTARVTLEPGGTITLLYLAQSNLNPIARLDLDLDGRTTLAARGAANQYQSYTVTMTIRGNALDEDGLQFDAFSDPPDLSRDQILAALGQKDVLEGITAGSLSGDTLRESLFTFAVPLVTQQFFGELANSLQLDYVALDYSPFDGAVINAGKTLGRGLLLQASRQLSTPSFGAQRWSVQLTYRLPSRDDFLSRLQFGIGVDQDSPWKFSINWGRRF